MGRRGRHGAGRPGLFRARILHGADDAGDQHEAACDPRGVLEAGESRGFHSALP